MLKKIENIIESMNNDTLPFESGTFDFRFDFLNIFPLNGTEISSKPVSYSEFLV